MPASVAGLCNTVMYGLLTNGNWILTSIGMIIVTVTTLTYYSIVHNYVDFVTISVMSNTLIFITIVLYRIEKREKMEFLAYNQIKQMNDELKTILMNLPEGIILINEDNK